MTLRLIDLFSGAGGMSLGFSDKRFCGGFETVLAIDNDKAAIKTHELNFPGRSIQANIEEWLLNNEVPQADVVIGGPPCQGFSLLNKKRDGDARRALWEPFIEIAERSGARVFVMENVAELYRSPERQLIEAKAAQHGFQTQAVIVNAADYGAPQTRKRTIILGWRAAYNLPNFPPLPSHADPKLKSNLPRWRTVRDVIADLPVEAIGTEIGSHPTLNLHFGRSARREPVRPAGQPSRHHARLLGSQDQWRHRPVRPPVVESPIRDDPNGVLQTGEGPLPASGSEPSDHSSRGGAPHGIPGRLQILRHQGRGRPADRKRCAA
jgi:site-specific DNA-cytosine methylase